MNTDKKLTEADVIPVDATAFKAAEAQKWAWWVRLPHVSAN